MTSGFVTIITVSLLGLLVVLLISVVRTHQWRGFSLELVGLVALTILLNRVFGYPWPSAVEAKGPGDEWIVAIALFLCMVLGMFCQYVYRRFERPQGRRPKWDWGLFVAPVFASPIVFIPLLASLGGANISSGSLTSARLMIFLVAFQNGFFWKEFFDRKQREKEAKE
jgi:hypothetical protein